MRWTRPSGQGEKFKAEQGPGEGYDRLLKGLILLLIAAALFLFVMVTYTGREFECDSDMYSDEMAARVIWETKSLFPENWTFGNQYNVVSTPVAMALFYGLTHSMSLSLVLGSALMNLFLVISFLWAVRPFCTGLQRLLGLSVLLCCVIAAPATRSLEGQLLYVMANYYACYVIVLLVVWGDWARLLSGKRTGLTSVSFFIALLLSCLIGMQSIRQFMMMVLPMAAAEVLRLLRLAICRLRTGERLSRRALLPTLAVLCYGGANLTGYLWVRSLQLPGLSIYGDVGLRPIRQWAEQLPSILNNILHIIGWENLKGWGRPPLPLLLCLLSVGMVLAALVLVGVHLIKGRDIFACGGMELMVLLALISFLGMIAVELVITIKVRSVYYVIWYPLVAFSGALLFSAIPKAAVRRGFAAVLWVLLFSNLFYSYGSALRAVQEPEKQGNLEKQVSDWIVERGYEYLYGNWYLANRIAPYADGAYLTGCWYENIFEPLTYINRTDLYTEEHNRNAVYLVRDYEQGNKETALREKGVELELQAVFGGGVYCLYTSPVQLMEAP